MNIFGIGLPEIVIILVVALLIFGPKKLPEIGRSLGEAIRRFQQASKEFEAEFNRETQQIEQAAKTTGLPKSEKVEVVAPEGLDIAPVKSANPPKSGEATTAHSEDSTPSSSQQG